MRGAKIGDRREVNRQSPFSREEEREDLDLHTSNLIPLTSVPHAVHRPSKERRARSRIRTLRDDGEGTLPDDSAPMRAFQDSL